MPKFAANLSLLFTDVPFCERFARATAAGFSGVEYLFPYEYPASDIADWLRANNSSTQLNMKQKNAATPTPALIKGKKIMMKKRGKV